jgi:hypothetical protein
MDHHDAFALPPAGETQCAYNLSPSAGVPAKTPKRPAPAPPPRLVKKPVRLPLPPP